MSPETATPIVLLTGPPGGGKSTVGRLVAEAFDRSVHLEADVVRESTVSGFVQPGPEAFAGEGLRQFQLQREIVTEWAKRTARDGYVTVIDDAPIPPAGHFEQQYAELLALPMIHPVILRADGDVVRQRIRDRGGEFDGVLVGLVDAALGFLDDLDDSVWHTVDSTDLSIEATAAAIVAHVRSASAG